MSQNPHSDPTVPLRPEDSLADIVGDLTDQFSTLVRQEVELAKVETTQEVRKAVKAGSAFGVAGVAVLMALLMVSFAAAWGLAELVPAGWAFLIVGVVYGIGAAVAATVGRNKAEQVDTNLPQTTESLQRTGAWAKNQP